MPNMGTARNSERTSRVAALTKAIREMLPKNDGAVESNYLIGKIIYWVLTALDPLQVGGLEP